MLVDLLIDHWLISTAYPQANGQAERFVGLTCEGLRRLMAEYPESFWDELLPGICAGLRFGVSTAHCARPADVAFKQPCRHPGYRGEPLAEDKVELATDTEILDRLVVGWK